MKAMILAAGLGTRLRPLTLTTPKPLLEVGSKPLIVWHIEALRQAGIEDIVINTAWLGEKLVAALGDGNALGVRIAWSHESEPLETAGGIIRALPLLGSEPFVLINGDVWTRYPLSSLMGHTLGNDLAHLVLVPNPPQHPAGDFRLLDGRVAVKVGDANSLPSSHSPQSSLQSSSMAYTFSGLSKLHPALFAGHGEGKAALAPFLKAAMNAERVSGALWEGAWVDVGTPERLRELDQQIQQGTI